MRPQTAGIVLINKAILVWYLAPALASSTSPERFISHVEDLGGREEGDKT